MLEGRPQERSGCLQGRRTMGAAVAATVCNGYLPANGPATRSDRGPHGAGGPLVGPAGPRAEYPLGHGGSARRRSYEILGRSPCSNRQAPCLYLGSRPADIVWSLRQPGDSDSGRYGC